MKWLLLWKLVGGGVNGRRVQKIVAASCASDFMPQIYFSLEVIVSFSFWARSNDINNSNNSNNSNTKNSKNNNNMKISHNIKNSNNLEP